MKLAEVETIRELLPIEGADKIELARVQGWQSVVKKGEYRVGDIIIFVPIDTVLEPQPWNAFLHDKNDPSKPIRVKTAKLRGAISQGIIFPKEIVMNYDTEPSFVPQVGDDVAALIGVTKYEKPVPAHLAGQVAGDFPTHLVSKTDEDNLKSNIEVLEELRKADFVEATLKIDGTSATYIKELDGTFRVCSRNLELKDTESNVHWQMARKYNIQENLKAGYCIQGEISGPGIQGNPAGCAEVNFLAFNVFELHDRRPLARIAWDLICLDIKKVDLVAVFSNEEFASMSIDKLQDFANKLTYANKAPAEGIVLRGLQEGSIMYSKKLQKMLSVKIINQNYKD